MLRTLHKTLLLCVVAWGIVLLPSQASAAASLVCVNGTPVGQTQLYYTGASDTEGACEFTGIYHIFSHLICSFVLILNDVLGKVYCGMQFSMISVLSAVITVYVAIFGVQMLMGTAQLNAREVLTRLFKIIFVWLFATQSAWGINVAFDFFITLAGDGVGWVMSAIPNAMTMDNTSPCYDSQAVSVGGVMSAFTKMDYIICNAVIGPLTEANQKVVGFFMALSVVLPPVFALAVYWVWMNFSILVRALISFLLGVAALAFLIAMSPIFMSMMLFRSTYQFFENWLKYMISFSLQIIIVFAVIAMWITVTFYFINFFNEIADTIFPFQKLPAASAAQQITDSWGICPYDYYPDVGGFGPYVECTNPGFNPATNPNDRDKLIPASALLMAKDPVSGAPINHTSFLYYVVYHLITLLVVCYGFDALMREAPAIATQLAGPQYVPMLGGGLGFNRYGQIMTRASEQAERSPVLSRGLEPPGFLRKATGALSGTAASGIIKNYRDRVETLITKRPAK